MLLGVITSQEMYVDAGRSTVLVSSRITATYFFEIETQEIENN